MDKPTFTLTKVIIHYDSEGFVMVDFYADGEWISGMTEKTRLNRGETLTLTMPPTSSEEDPPSPQSHPPELQPWLPGSGYKLRSR